jgi:methyl-accepting chemotaxis protein
MLKFRSISARLVLAISLTVATACATLAAFSIIQQQTLTRLALDQELKVQYESVIAALNYEGRAALAVSATIAALPPVGEAVANDDRDGLMKLLGTAQDALKAQGIRFVNLTAAPATMFLRIHDPKAYGDDISARRKTVVAANATGASVVGVERARDTLAIYAMTPVVHGGSRFVVDVGIVLGTEFADRIKQRLGVDVAIHAFEGQEFATLASTFAERTTASPEQIKNALTGMPVRREAQIGGHSAAVYLGQIKNYAGEPIAVLEIVKDTTLYEVARSAAMRNLMLSAAAILLLGGVVALLLGCGLSRPIAALTGTMNRLSGGDTEIPIPGRDRADELGTMATAVEVFRLGMIDAKRLGEAQRVLAAEQFERQRVERELGLQQERNELLVARSRMVEELGAAKESAEAALRNNEQITRELRAAQSELVTTARQAGMAQIATNVLHNVGNVLNSVNISAGLVSSRMRDSKAQGLANVVRLINDHAADLGDYLTRDEKGKLLPSYLNKLAVALAEERQGVVDELGLLARSVDHIKDIVATQQSFAGAASIVELVQIQDLLEDALRMNAGALARHHVTVVKEFAEVPVLLLDKHLVLQILVNLISNAKQAMDDTTDRPHEITLRVDVADGADGRRLRICVEDDGVGIAPENLSRLFTHGFTTRKNGHGFGLHSCALAAKEMGGTLTARSDGPGKGAVFTLELPIKAVADAPRVAAANFRRVPVARCG